MPPFYGQDAACQIRLLMPPSSHAHLVLSGRNPHPFKRGHGVMRRKLENKVAVVTRRFDGYRPRHRAGAGRAGRTCLRDRTPPGGAEMPPFGRSGTARSGSAATFPAWPISTGCTTRSSSTSPRSDILVANAGGGTFEALGAISEESFDRTFAINVKGIPVHRAEGAAAAAGRGFDHPDELDRDDARAAIVQRLRCQQGSDP